MEFKRHTISDVNNSRFYQLPKFLFEGEFKENLSSDTKMLYALLRDRHELSLQNGWVNDRKEVFLIFTRDEMCDMLGCGKDKIIKLLNELKKCGLLEEERQGVNKPNLIFLNYIDVNALKPSNDAEFGKSEVRSSEKPKSGLLKNRSLDFGKSERNETNINKTEINDTDNSINQSAKNEKQIFQEELSDVIDTIDEKISYSEIIKSNIDYEIYQENLQYKEFFSNTYELMLDVITSSTPTVRVGKENKPHEVVKSRFLKLNGEHVEYVYSCLQENKTKINNIRNWLITALYNAPVTMDSFFTSAVNYDLYGSNH